MSELIFDIINAAWAALLPLLEYLYTATLKHWVAGLGAAILGALFGFFGFWRRRRRSKFVAAFWSAFGIFVGAWIGGMIDGLYPLVKACGKSGLITCMEWAGIAPASIFALLFVAAALSEGSKKNGDN